MQEPKVVAPVAVPCADVMLNEGVAVALVNATVVAPVVPKAGTPDAKLTGWFTTAAAVVALTEAATLAVDVRVAPVKDPPLPPPPHAERTALQA